MNTAIEPRLAFTETGFSTNSTEKYGPVIIQHKSRSIIECIENGFDEERQPQQHNNLEMENREDIIDEEGHPQNENIFCNNQNWYRTTDHKTLYLLIIRSTEETINEE